MLKLKQFFLKKVEAYETSKLEYRSLEKNYDLANVNRTACKECGGICCKQCGCHFSPDDFTEITYESLKKELEKGYISIDYVDESYLHKLSGIYILRIRNKNSPIVDTSHNGQCILWDEEKGCPFPDRKRPTGGRLLIPDDEIKKIGFLYKKTCNQKYPIQDCCYEWEPHQKVLKKLVRHFRNEYVECLFKG